LVIARNIDACFGLMNKMKSILKNINNKTSGRVAGFATLAALFLIGFNFNRLVIPETIFVLIISVLTALGLLANATHIYWTSFLWTQYTRSQKVAKIIKIIFFLSMIFITASINLRVINIYFR
jgi:hypothetical protein